jgi:hypothetical protein
VQNPFKNFAHELRALGCLGWTLPLIPAPQRTSDHRLSIFIENS